MAKIVILRIPGTHTDFRTRNPIPNLGVGFLAAIAREEGHTVTVLEGHMWIDSGYLPLSLSYKERIDFFIKEVEEEAPDIVGISVLSCDLALGIEFAKAYRLKHPGVFLIMGGVGINGVAEIVARYAGNSLDVLVKGEGEITFREILQELKKGKNGDFQKILGISYRKGEKWIHNLLRPLIRDLDSIPMTTLDGYKHLPPNIRTLLPVERGCSSKCRFCFATETWGNGRYFSLDRIKRQGELLLGFQKTVQTLFLSDSNILAHEEIGANTLDFILNTFPEAVGSVNVRVDQISPQLVEIFSHYPQISPLMGIEALSPNLLLYLGKTNDPDNYLKKVNEIIPLIRKSGIRYCLSLIYHIPGEKKEDLEKITSFFYEQDPEKCSLIYLSRLWLEGNTSLWHDYEKGEVEVFALNKLASSALGEQYDDVVFEPLSFTFKNPFIKEIEYLLFAKKIRDHFRDTSCSFLG